MTAFAILHSDGSMTVFPPGMAAQEAFAEFEAIDEEAQGARLMHVTFADIGAVESPLACAR